MKLEFEKNVVFSTAHISLEDSKKLSAWARKIRDFQGDEFLVYEYPEGFFVYIPPLSSFADALDDAEHHGMSPGFIKLFILAKDNECKFLHLDGDGPQHEELENYDW